MSRDALAFKAIKEARDHHNGTCKLGPAIEVHMNPYDIRRLDWTAGDTIAGLLLVGNEQIQPDKMRIVCDGESKQMSHATVPLAQPKEVEVPDFMPEVVTA